MRVIAGHPLLERERELERLETLLWGLHAGSGWVVVVTGPAGIGKSALLGVVDASARGAGVAVLQARCVEFERELAFGAVAQLFEDFLRRATPERRAGLLEGAARPVARLLGLNGRPLDGAAAVGFAAYHGLYWLCVNLTADSPLVLLVDDAHELDEESLGFLEYLARRLEGLPLLIVVAARPDGKEGRRLVRAASECGGDVLALNVLSATAVDHVVQETLDKSPEAEFLDALWTATGGNPFLLHELLLTVREEGVTPDAAGARSIRTLGSDRIGQAILVRLHRLSPAAVALARAIAIVGRGGSLTVAARLADLDEASAADAVDGLVAASVLASGGQLEFRHPVVEASIYQDMAAPARTLRHRQAARLLAEIDAPPAAVAVHLLKAEPIGDPWTIEVLRSAAAESSARGAPQAGIAFLERALAERSDEDVELLLELGRAAHAALQIPKAIDALSRGLRKADVAEHGPVALELVRTLLHVGRAEEAVSILKAELGSTDELDQELRLLLEVEYVLYAGPRVEALATARRLGRLAGQSVAELAALAVASSMTETASEAAELASRALAEGVLVRAAEAQPAWFLAPWMLIRADRLDDAAKVVAEALDRSQTTGSHLTFARSSWLRAEIEYRTGDLLAAEAQLRNAYAVASDGGSTWVRLMAGALLVQVLADRGAFAEAAELAGGLDMSRIPSHERLTRPVHYARAYLALLSGRLDEAIAGFEQMTEKMPVARAGRSRFATGMTVHAIALRRAGRHEEAKYIAEDELVWARGWGVPRSIGIALRGWAAPNGVERVQTLEESIAVLEDTPARLELALTLGDLGSTLRRDNHRTAARDPLRRALDLAAGCRADALAEHLRAELRAAGAKPRRDALRGRDALTATELRIAELAATGKTNSQIAQTIFVTPATVEKHLTSVYSKLGIASRQHLPAALSGGPWSVSGEGP